MERFNRAERRHQTERIKRNRRGYWGRGQGAHSFSNSLTPRELGRVASAPKIMSWCWCCGNHRRLFGKLTHKEIAAQQEGLHHPGDVWTREEAWAEYCTPETPCPRCAKKSCRLTLIDG